MRRAVAAVDGAAVELLEGADTNVLAEIDVASDRGGTDIIPVGIVGSELLASAGLDDVNPDRDLELACPRGKSRGGSGTVQRGWERCCKGERAAATPSGNTCDRPSQLHTRAETSLRSRLDP